MALSVGGTRQLTEDHVRREGHHRVAPADVFATPRPRLTRESRSSVGGLLSGVPIGLAYLTGGVILGVAIGWLGVWLMRTTIDVSGAARQGAIPAA